LRRREDVWDYVEFTSVLVPRQGRLRDRYIFLLGTAHWYERPGLSILFKNGEFFALSRRDGSIPAPTWDVVYINE